MQPLSSFRRNLYLVIAVILFILLIPVLIMYSLGYRLGDALSLVETGGVYVRSEVPDTRIYINEELKETTGLLIRNSFIQDLQPGQYIVRVEKDGYREWVKQVNIDANFVTEITYLAVPEEIASTTVQEFVLEESSAATTSTQTVRVPNPQFIEIEEIFNATTTDEDTALDLDVSTATASTIVFDPRTQNDGFRENVGMYSWLEEGNIVVNWPGTYEKTPYFFCRSAECVATTTIDLAEDVQEFEWIPARSEALVVVTDTGLYIVGADVRSAPNIYKIYEGTDLSIRLIGRNIVVKDDDVFVILEL